MNDKTSFPKVKGGSREVSENPWLTTPLVRLPWYLHRTQSRSKITLNSPIDFVYHHPGPVRLDFRITSIPVNLQDQVRTQPEVPLFLQCLLVTRWIILDIEWAESVNLYSDVYWLSRIFGSSTTNLDTFYSHTKGSKGSVGRQVHRH